MVDTMIDLALIAQARQLYDCQAMSIDDIIRYWRETAEMYNRAAQDCKDLIKTIERQNAIIERQILATPYAASRTPQ